MSKQIASLQLACRCGHVRGVARDVAPPGGFRFICYCTDCQAFARVLDRPDVLDAASGTDIFQMPAGHVMLTAGHAALRCLRFSTHVYRWYTDCCRTPIANTAGPRFPMVALYAAFISDGDRDAALGPPRCRLFATSAAAPLPANTPPPPSPALRLRRVAKIFGWWIGGFGRPHPFFDARTKAPLATPRVVTAEERAALG